MFPVTAPLWPDTERLPRFHAFLKRLADLPASVGGVSLADLRDINLPDPAALPSAPSSPEPPERVEANWLAGALAPVGAFHAGGNVERASAHLIGVAATLRARPDWVLTAMWLLEVAAAWLETVAPGALLFQARAELGDLYCQAGQLLVGEELLRQAEQHFGTDAAARVCTYRAARWEARLLRRPTAFATLRGISSSGNGKTDAVGLHAELELLLLDPRQASGDMDGLVQASARAQAALHRAEQARLPKADRIALRAQADHVVAKLFATSPNRYIQGQARALFEHAILGYGQAGSPSDQAQALDGLGRAHAQLGDHAAARAAFERSIHLRQRLRDCFGLGASLNGLGDLLVRNGQPLAALPFYEADILLLRSLGGMDRLIGHNLRRHLGALLQVNQSPFTTARPSTEVLGRAVMALADYAHLSELGERDPHYLMLAGAWQRAAALAAEDTEMRAQLLQEGQELLESSIALFQANSGAQEAARARLHLAHLLLDRVGPNVARDRARARQLLEEAERQLWDGVDRLYLDLVWAWYYQAAGQPRQVQRHLAAARRAAELNGSHALALEVDSRLGVQFLGPTGEAETDVVVSPSGKVELEFRAIDWRGRPLSGYAVHSGLEASEEDGAHFAVEPASATTDHLGRAVFTVRSDGSGRCAVLAGDADAVHGARARVWAQECVIEPGGVVAEPIDLTEEDRHLLRQLFGPGYSRLRVHRRFGAGRSGADVLLVEPFRTGATGGELRGQPCIVKLGGRLAMQDEWQRHERWVKDVLPVNVSRCERHTAWSGRGALRMGLAAGQDWARARDACEWLTATSAFEAHLLLERVFVGDLATCWYTNDPRTEPAQPLAQSYGRLVPPLLTLQDTDPPRGLLSRSPHEPVADVIEGLRPSAERSFRIGDEVSLSGLTVTGFRPAVRGGWEYELRLPGPPLRVAFRTPLPPELIAREGNPERLLNGVEPWGLQAQVQATAYDQLDAALRRCIARFRDDHPGEGLALSADGARLRVAEREWPNPLPHLAELLFRAFPCHTSIIHGDLHGGNIIVGHQGQPFYIDFGKTGPGPTLFDFVKFEVYLWHDNFAGWPTGDPPTECGLSGALRLLDDASAADPWRRFPSPYALLPFAAGRTDWLTCFAQCLATLRSAARPYILAPEDEDYFLPLCLAATLMLRWCDPESETDERQRRQAARRGTFHALVAASLLANGVVRGNGAEPA